METSFATGMIMGLISLLFLIVYVYLSIFNKGGIKLKEVIEFLVFTFTLLMVITMIIGFIIYLSKIK